MQSRVHAVRDQGRSQSGCKREIMETGSSSSPDGVQLRQSTATAECRRGQRSVSFRRMGVYILTGAIQQKRETEDTEGRARWLE